MVGTALSVSTFHFCGAVVACVHNTKPPPNHQEIVMSLHAHNTYTQSESDLILGGFILFPLIPHVPGTLG